MGGRTRLVAYYLEHELLGSSRKLQNILHIAPELWLSGIIRRLENIDYVAADLKPEHYDDTVKPVRADIIDLPWAANSFDLVICNHVLEHVPDDRRAMSELYRVTRPKGLAILQVPIARKLSATIEDPSVQCPIERERRFGQGDHVRIYGADYSDRLRNAGFEIEIFNPLTAWGLNTVEILRLDPAERIFLARKSDLQFPGVDRRDAIVEVSRESTSTH
jgi:SAM-dependent methyltransferase